MSFSGRQLLGEDADHHLRIVAPGDGRQHLFADFQHRPPAATVRAATFSTAGLPRAGLGEDQRPDRPAEIERVDDQLQSFGHEGVLLVAEFLQRQRLDVLDQRVGEAGDFLDLAGRAGAPVVVHVGHPARKQRGRKRPARPISRG